MHPVLLRFEWAGQPCALGSYGLCLALAIVLGAALALRAAVKQRLDAGAVIASLASAVGGGFLGAYLLFAAVGCMRGLPLSAALARPGIVFYGGAFGALLGFYASARWLSLPRLVALDAFTPALPLAHALGRIGCFLGGCCYGAPSHSRFAVVYRDPLAPASHPLLARHPWPLYEAAALLVLSLVLSRWPARTLGDGRRFASYVAGYALLRMCLEPLRGDVVRGVLLHGLLSTSQLCAALTLLMALAFARGRQQCT